MRLKFIFSKLLLLCALSMAFPALSSAQTPAGIPADTSLKIIQFSGLAVDADSLTPLPYVAIIIRNSQRGVYSNLNGYYSIVAQEKDTVDF